MSTAFTIYRDAAGEFRWRATAPENGNTLAASTEGYARKEDASKSLFRILKAISVGCTVQVNDRPLDVNSLAEGVHDDQDEGYRHCAPDCVERSGCLTVGGLGHYQCGHCDLHGQPRHHCGCIVKERRR